MKQVFSNKLFYIVVTTLLLVGIFFITHNRTKVFDLQKGDILLQDLDCGELCDAIETVTQGVDGAKLSHIAVVSKIQHGTPYVIEAFTKGVVEIPFKEFSSRSYDINGNPKILVARLKPEKQNIIDSAIVNAQKLIGKKYDYAFDLTNDSYYCSEFIYEIFKDENQKHIFETNSMTFKDPKTGQTMDVWTKYFMGLDIPVPEGKIGINPGAISRSKYVEIVYSYGCPEGWTKCPY